MANLIKLNEFIVAFFVLIWSSVAAASSLNKEWTCPMLPPASVESCEISKCPKVNGAFTFINGEIETWPGEVSPVETPIVDASTGKRGVIGSIAQMTESRSLEALEAATRAWDLGQGEWPQ
jgi:hypothetical protein